MSDAQSEARLQRRKDEAMDDFKLEIIMDELMVGQQASMGNSSRELRIAINLLARSVGLGCVEPACDRAASSFHLTLEGKPVAYCNFHGKTRYGKVPTTWKDLTVDEYKVAKIMQS